MPGPMKLCRRGEFVWITYDGSTTSAMVGLASPDGESAFIFFKGKLGGYVGSMAILWNEAAQEYVDLMNRRPLVVTPYPS